MTPWILLLTLTPCARVPTTPPVDAVSGATPRYAPMDLDPHGVHDPALPCTSCHHGDPPSQAPCHTCHPGDEERRVLHGQCLPCHRERRQEAPPVECLQCHQERR